MTNFLKTPVILVLTSITGSLPELKTYYLFEV